MTKQIPLYPDFSDIVFDMKDEIEFYLKNLPDGISEMTFLNLYLFRNVYKYKVSKTESLLIITGEYSGESFFITPCCSVNSDIIEQLFDKYKKWMLLSDSFIEKNKKNSNSVFFENLKIEEDRDNFDYIYLCKDLAELPGKKFHKKRTHINNFEKKYKNIEIKPISENNVKDAIKLLDIWAASKPNEMLYESDYYPALEALSLIDKFELLGIILYVNNEPAAWTLAEIRYDQKTAITLFEKADISYSGSFQYVNYAFANYLSDSIQYINREQDLGNAGLRQSKMTYNPIKFIKKYKCTRV